jgi:hypothetical protein
MAMKSLGFAGIGIAVLTIACGGDMPLAPSQLNNGRAAVAEAPMSSASSAAAPRLTIQSAEVVVTLQPDRTVSPSSVSIPEGQTVLVVNNSTQYVRIRSFNCSEFAALGLQPGVARHTYPFRPAGKTCDFFVYDYPQKIFPGHVTVY